MLKKLILIMGLLISILICANEDNNGIITLKYNTSNLENLEIEYPSVFVGYKKNKEYSLSYTREWEKNEFEKGLNLLEFYKGNYYFLIGQSSQLNLSVGLDYTYKLLTLGIKMNNYDDTTVKYYKIQGDYYFKNGIISTGKVNLVDDGKTELNYMLKLNYNIFNYSYYFDFNDLNKGVFEIKKDGIMKKYFLGFSYATEFNTNKNAASLSLGYNF
ncbi:MAG: hypothetical protein KA384_09530 [Leptotrichiaceae bacterium]|nr:hypothetical protein [Leptotrichiaceae bacterium]